VRLEAKTRELAAFGASGCDVEALIGAVREVEQTKTGSPRMPRQVILSGNQAKGGDVQDTRQLATRLVEGTVPRA
jgi:hypothetical protein